MVDTYECSLSIIERNLNRVSFPVYILFDTVWRKFCPVSGDIVKIARIFFVSRTGCALHIIDAENL